MHEYTISLIIQALLYYPSKKKGAGFGSVGQSRLQNSELTIPYSDLPKKESFLRAGCKRSLYKRKGATLETNTILFLLKLKDNGIHVFKRSSYRVW